MPINILYIIDSLTHGGTEKQLVQLIQGLGSDRFCPHLCTLKASEDLYDEINVPKICLGFVSFSHFSIIKNIAQLTFFIRKNNIQIVQTFFQDPFLIGAMVKLFSKIKLIGSFRDLGFWRTKAETRKMRISYPFFSGFIANSAAVKEHFVQTDKINPDKIEVIYNGIKLEGLHSKNVESFDEKPALVGIVANMNRPVKRVHDFIYAAAIIYKEKPDTKFIVVGDGYLRKDLELLSESLGLSKVLHFTGRLSDPLKIIQQLHVGVITSETEGFCNVILEYMAHGLPVVATNSGGNSELVKQEENGFLYPVGNVDALAAKILQILKDKQLISKIRENNIQLVSSKYSYTSFIENQCSFYERI